MITKRIMVLILYDLFYSFLSVQIFLFWNEFYYEIMYHFINTYLYIIIWMNNLMKMISFIMNVSIRI